MKRASSGKGLVFFPTVANPGTETKPYHEWRSTCWPANKNDPADVLAWLDFYTAENGPLWLTGALRNRNPKQYASVNLRRWLLDDAWWLASSLALNGDWPSPPPKPSPAATVAELSQQLVALRLWIAKGQPMATDAKTRLLALYTGNAADDRIKQAEAVLESGGTVNERLEGLDKALKIPATASAQELADALLVKKQTVHSSKWWQSNRAGLKDEIVDGRERRLKERGKRYDVGADE